MENRCKKCYENDRTPDENDCKKCQEIMIDSVDVSECKHFIKEYIEDGYAEDDCCVYIKNACEINLTECCLVTECYFKQLKRLEAQNRELKACLEDFNKPEVKKVLVYYHTGELDRLEDKCEALEQENNKLKTQYNCYACGSCKGKEDYINLEKHHKGLRIEFDRLHKEIRRLKWYLNEIRYQELQTLDIDWDEYETGCRDTEYTNIIELVQEALDEVPEEDCRYNRKDD